jgi:hypothetical protein
MPVLRLQMVFQYAPSHWPDRHPRWAVVMVLSWVALIAGALSP